MPRLFVAAWPDEGTVDALRRLPRPDERGVRWVPPANWHVTLRFVGDAEIDAVTASLAAASLPSATATLGPAVARLGRRLVVVPIAGVDALAAAVAGATLDIGETATVPFRGHLTLARTDRGAASAVLGAPVVARFDVAVVALVRSDPGRSGPTYRTVATFRTG